MVYCDARSLHEDHGGLEKSFLVYYNSLQEQAFDPGLESSGGRQDETQWREWLQVPPLGMVPVIRA